MATAIIKAVGCSDGTEDTVTVAFAGTVSPEAGTFYLSMEGLQNFAAPVTGIGGIWFHEFFNVPWGPYCVKRDNGSPLCLLVKKESLNPDIDSPVVGWASGNECGSGC